MLRERRNSTGGNLRQFERVQRIAFGYHAPMGVRPIKRSVARVVYDRARRRRPASRILQVWLLALMTGLILACGSGADQAHYAALLDKIVIPSEWQLVHTTTQRPGGPDHEVSADRTSDDIDCAPLVVSCPAVIRSYLAPGTPIALLPVAKKILTDAGYSIDQVIGPNCEGRAGGAACSIESLEGTDHISVYIYNPGDAPQDFGVSRPDHFIVVLSAEPKK
jgi:hypothetical protein